jgi:hypothetical protein
MERSFFSIATAKLKILGKQGCGFILSRLTDGYVMVRLSPQGATVATQYREQQKLGGCLASLDILIDAAGIAEIYQALCLIVGQWCSEKEPLKSAAVADALVSVGRQPEKSGQPLTDTRPACATPIEIVCHLTEYISLHPKVGSITAGHPKRLLDDGSGARLRRVDRLGLAGVHPLRYVGAAADGGGPDLCSALCVVHVGGHCGGGRSRRTGPWWAAGRGPRQGREMASISNIRTEAA